MGALQYIVEGGRRLSGTIRPSGNKNAALPIVAASLLTTSAGLAQQVERQRTATQPTSTATPKQQKEASKKASAAARVFDQIMNAPDN